MSSSRPTLTLDAPAVLDLTHLPHHGARSQAHPRSGAARAEHVLPSGFVPSRPAQKAFPSPPPTR